MALAPDLETHLRAARLEALLPVLSELGVENLEDLEFMEEQDIEERGDITVIHKRRFLEWKAKLFEEGSSTTASSESMKIAKIAVDKQKLADKKTERERQHPTIGQTTLPQTTSADIVDKAPSVVTPLSLQTPRTRALPLVQVLRELEALDLALQEERIRSTNATEELQKERKQRKKIAEELQKEREQLQKEREHSKSIAEELERVRSVGVAEELQEERNHSARIVAEKQANEQNHARDIAALEEMLEHLLAENARLKATSAARETGNATNDGAEPEPGQDIADARNSALYEPEMEPRRTLARTLADRLCQQAAEVSP